MCGRYTLRDAAALRALIESLTGESYEDFMARYNVAPAQTSPVVRSGPGGRPTRRQMRWGLAPAGAAADQPGRAHINVRAETMFAKRTFRAAVQQRRCVVPADGYYEWQRPDERTRRPHFISLREGRPFFIAAIHETATVDRPETFALLTCEPNRLMAGIHHRMPVILDEPGVRRWLQPGPLAPREAATLCQPCADEAMQVWPVSSLVNRARHDDPACVVPVEPYIEPQGAFDF